MVVKEIVIPAVKKQTATLIILHGLGDTGYGWTFLAENLRARAKFDEVGFILPSAPEIPITVNRGMKMPGWYDILTFDSLNRSDDEAGVMASRKYVHGLIDAQLAKGIPADRVILGGFSQGGAVSLFSGLTYRERLGGVFGLSCYQVLEKKFDALRTEVGEEKKPKVFMAHGSSDPVVRFEWGRTTADGLKRRGFDLTWKEYQGLQHSACPEEIDDLERWLGERLGESQASAL